MRKDTEGKSRVRNKRASPFVQILEGSTKILRGAEAMSQKARRSESDREIWGWAKCEGIQGTAHDMTRVSVCSQ